MPEDAQKIDEQINELRAELAELKLRRRGARWGIRKRSRTRVFGLPLYEVAIGPDPARGEQRGWAVGVFAVGDVAMGVVSLGGVAMGLFAVGGLSLGLLLTIGGCAIGLVALGGVAVGGIALGGVAVGGIAVGGAAVGYFVGGTAAFGPHPL